MGTSCVLEVLDGLETNKFAVVEEVRGHIVITLIGLDIVGGVAVAAATVVVGIKVANALDSNRGFSINLTFVLPPTCLVVPASLS